MIKSNVEIWKPTMELAWKRVSRDDFPSEMDVSVENTFYKVLSDVDAYHYQHVCLMQKWISNKGGEEWRPIKLLK